MGDLQFQCVMNRSGDYYWKDLNQGTFKGSSGGKVICISACAVGQIAYGGPIRGVRYGLFTAALVTTILNLNSSSYGSLLMSVRDQMEISSGRPPISDNVSAVGTRARYFQEPWLSSNFLFPVFSSRFILFGDGDSDSEDLDDDECDGEDDGNDEAIIIDNGNKSAAKLEAPALNGQFLLLHNVELDLAQENGAIYTEQWDTYPLKGESS